MYGIRAVAAAHLRARWRGLLALGLLLGLVGGVVLAAGALAVRTATAYPRLVEAVALDDARVLMPADQPALAAAVPGMAGVESAWVVPAFIAQVDGPALRFVSVGAGLDPPSDLLTPVIVDGRAPAPDAVDEVVVGEPLAEMGGFAVGDELTLRMLTLDEVAQFAVGFGEPDGPVVASRVVGIARMPAWGGGPLPNVLGGPGFARAHGAEAVGKAGFVRLRDEPGAAAAFSADYAATAAAQPESVVAMYLPPQVQLPTADVDPSVRTAERVLTGGLAVFAVVLAAGGLLVLGQGVARHHGGGWAAQRVESALGLTAVQRAVARVLAAGPGAVLAGAVGAAFAVAAGVLQPLGSQSRFEPDPGFRPPWVLAVAGAVLLVVVFLALHAAAAAWAGRPRGSAPPPPAASRNLWGAPPLVVGAGLALRGRRGLSGAATVLGASVAVAGVVAAATFGAGLQRLVDTPMRWGGVADLTVIDAREPDVAALAADPRVLGLDVVSSADVAFEGGAVEGGAVEGGAVAGGERLEVTARETRTGALPVETTAGRPPQRPGEIALGTRSAIRLGVHVGDTVTAMAPDGSLVPLTVTGLVVVRSEAYGSLGETAQVVPEQLAALVELDALVSAHVATVPGAAPELFAELSQRLEVFEREVPDAITNLADVARLPELLALVLALVGGAGVAHAVHTAARRHRPDLAVLAVLGATPGQVRATVAAMAATLAVPAVLIGIPLGVLVARVLWAEVARSTGVAGDVALPVPLLVAVGPVVLAGALLAAALPGGRAATAPPAAALRTD